MRKANNQRKSNVALSRRGADAWFERRAGSAVGLNALLDVCCLPPWMRKFRTREFDRATDPKVRPPANPRAILPQAYTSQTARTTERPGCDTLPSGELVAPPVPCRYARPPTPRGQHYPSSPRRSSRVGAGQERHLHCKRAVEPQHYREEQPPANGARPDDLPTR